MVDFSYNEEKLNNAFAKDLIDVKTSYRYVEPYVWIQKKYIKVIEGICKKVGRPIKEGGTTYCGWIGQKVVVDNKIRKNVKYIFKASNGQKLETIKFMEE